MPYLQFQAFYVCRLLSQEPQGSEAAEWLGAGASRDQTAQPPTKERVYRETPGRQAILDFNGIPERSPTYSFGVRILSPGSRQIPPHRTPIRKKQGASVKPFCGINRSRSRDTDTHTYIYIPAEMKDYITYNIINTR